MGKPMFAGAGPNLARLASSEPSSQGAVGPCRVRRQPSSLARGSLARCRRPGAL